MNDYRLNTHVHAVEYDDKGARTGREQVFGPGDNMAAADNEWALAAISNPDVWAEGKAPKVRPAPPAHQDEVAALKVRIAELEAEKAGAGQADAGDQADDASADSPKTGDTKTASRPRPTAKPNQ